MAERRAALGEDANTGDSLAENPSRSWAKRAECQLNRHVCVRQWTVNFASEQSAGVWNYSRTDYVDNFQCCSSIRDLVERLHYSRQQHALWRAFLGSGSRADAATVSYGNFAARCALCFENAA
jgi:hypothetical protein